MRDHINHISKIKNIEKEDDPYSYIKAKTLVLNVKFPEKIKELFLNISNANTINDKEYSLKCFYKKLLSFNTYGLDYKIKNCLYNSSQIIYLSFFDTEITFLEDYLIQIQFEEDNLQILNQTFGITPLKFKSWFVFQQKKIRTKIILHKGFFSFIFLIFYIFYH